MRNTSVNWPFMIQLQQQSGLSQREFCMQHGLALSTFTYWVRKLRPRKAVALDVVRPQFVELQLNTPERAESAPEELVVELPYGVVMRFRGLPR